MNAESDAATHWLSVELLSRYAEITHAGMDAGRLYPRVQRHLSECDACRSALGDLSHFLDKVGPSMPEPQARRDWLALLERPANVRWAWRPGSTPASFGLQVCMNADWLLSTTRRPGPESDAPSDTGVRLNFQWSLKANAALNLHLMLAPSTATPGRYDLSVRTTHSARACLTIGLRSHHADTQDGKLQFSDVDLNEGKERVSLTLDSC